MRKIHIFNLNAGKGSAQRILERCREKGAEHHVTQSVGDATRFIESVLKDDPCVHFVVYGGDGTLNEAVDGILRAGAGDTALLSIVPTGTGNDFSRLIATLGNKGDILTIDALKVNDGYAVNIVNTGFDCAVVDKTQKYKKLPCVSGGLAYVMGIADVLLHKMGQDWELTLTDPDGQAVHYEENGLLALFANGSYYGGGFHAAPLADLSDGLVDVLLVRTVTRRKFLSLVSAYRKGEHLDAATGGVNERFASFVEFRKCVKARITGITRLCKDGETSDADSAEITILPRAIRVQII